MVQRDYGTIDGLRTIVAVGILMMHVTSNNAYGILGVVYDSVIPSFANYSKRIKKIFLFFELLVLLEVAIPLSINAF